MVQKQFSDVALKITQLEPFTNQQHTTFSDVIDRVNDEASRSDRSIPGVIDTLGTPSMSNSSALSTAQALIVSLTASLADAESRRYVPCRNQRGPGRFVDGRGQGLGRRPTLGVLGPFNEAVDRRFTQKEDPNRIEKKYKNKLYCHTHGYECVDGHDSAHCMFPEKGHKTCATAIHPMGGCMLYKILYTAFCLECPG